jgi:methylenetetrahydrofolate dehydrogenase (NADP+)/methenyltetrahydrofolate cyclohydrolase
VIILDGKRSAARLLDEVRSGVEDRVARGKPRPHLAVVLVGNDPASEVYVRGKHGDAEKVGISSSNHRLPETATTEEVVAVVRQLNAEERVSGFLVQTPLPSQVSVAAVVEAIDPTKDVDGAHPVNAGRLLLGEEGFVACTPAGILRLLDDHQVPIEGRRAVVIGRSNIVGKPAALLLLRRNATVTVCHSRTVDLPSVAREAELLVAAIGRSDFVTPDMVRPGAAVVDVGITRVGSKLHGDVHPDVAKVAGWLSPVPGGFGPMTRGMLMWNTLRAEQQRRP